MLATYDAPVQQLPLGIMRMNDNDDAHIIRSRSILRSIHEALNAFRELSVTMPVGEVIMFLQVALNEGDSLSDLSDRADMKKSTASRYLLDLSDKTRAGGEGYGLVTRETDPNELRRNMYTLSPKGRTVIKKLVEGATKGMNGANLS